MIVILENPPNPLFKGENWQQHTVSRTLPRNIRETVDLQLLPLEKGVGGIFEQPSESVTLIPLENEPSLIRDIKGLSFSLKFTDQYSTKNPYCQWKTQSTSSKCSAPPKVSA